MYKRQLQKIRIVGFLIVLLLMFLIKHILYCTVYMYVMVLQYM